MGVKCKQTLFYTVNSRKFFTSRKITSLSYFQARFKMTCFVLYKIPLWCMSCRHLWKQFPYWNSLFHNITLFLIPYFHMEAISISYGSNFHEKFAKFQCAGGSPYCLFYLFIAFINLEFSFPEYGRISWSSTSEISWQFQVFL